MYRCHVAEQIATHFVSGGTYCHRSVRILLHLVYPCSRLIPETACSCSAWCAKDSAPREMHQVAQDWHYRRVMTNEGGSSRLHPLGLCSNCDDYITLMEQINQNCTECKKGAYRLRSRQAHWETCTWCEGTGLTRFGIVEECHTCQGSGWIPTRPLEL